MILIWYHYFMSMKLINKDTDYAVRALCNMANHERDGKEYVASVTRLVNQLKVPRAFLRKILQILDNEGILVSRKGQGGGFKLARRPEDVYLTNLIEIFQGRISLNECIFKKKVCPNRGECVLRQKISEIEKNTLAQLKSINIAHLI